MEAGGRERRGGPMSPSPAEAGREGAWVWGASMCGYGFSLLAGTASLCSLAARPLFHRLPPSCHRQVPPLHLPPSPLAQEDLLSRWCSEGSDNRGSAAGASLGTGSQVQCTPEASIPPPLPQKTTVRPHCAPPLALGDKRPPAPAPPRRSGRPQTPPTRGGPATCTGAPAPGSAPLRSQSVLAWAGGTGM